MLMGDTHAPAKTDGQGLMGSSACMPWWLLIRLSPYKPINAPAAAGAEIPPALRCSDPLRALGASLGGGGAEAAQGSAG